MRGLHNLCQTSKENIHLCVKHRCVSSPFWRSSLAALWVGTLCVCCIYLTAMEMKASGDIPWFSPLFCRKVMSIKVDVICDLLPPSFFRRPPTLLSFPVTLLWWTKWAFSFADKQRWECESVRDATLPHSGEKKKKTKKTQKKRCIECLARCLMVSGSFMMLQQCRKGSLYCWTSKVCLLTRKGGKTDC